MKESYIAPFPDGHFSLITLGPKPHDEQETPEELPPQGESPRQPLVDEVVP